MKEVKREAKVGEYIKIVKPILSDGYYKEGDVLKVSYIDSPRYLHVVENPRIIHCDEYVVLEETEEKKEIKLKVGDKVLLRSDLINGARYGFDIFISPMKKGELITVLNVFDNYFHIENGNGYRYTPEMVLDVITELNLVFTQFGHEGKNYLFLVPFDVKLKVGDKVFVDTKKGRTNCECTSDSFKATPATLNIMRAEIGITYEMKSVVGYAEKVTKYNLVEF